ncbi:hypothetical protein, partial [Streptomyces sp. CBMA156]|uniref:hypothetical protein n=1 Tax=Streptomyces sp. CBMA156 TaxID=1930280 RepID=UPI001CB86C5F
ARPGRRRPLLLVAADSTTPGRWQALSTLAGAVAALDPDLRRALRGARTRDDGWTGLETALPLPPGAREQQARVVCAWADATVVEEMRESAERAEAAGGLRADTLSPTGLRLSRWQAARRRASTPVSTARPGAQHREPGHGPRAGPADQAARSQTPRPHPFTSEYPAAAHARPPGIP